MKIPFAGLFQRGKGRTQAQENAVKKAPIPVVRKAEGERLAKTVLPSSARAVTQADEHLAPGTSVPVATETARAGVGTEPAGSPLASAGRTGETPVLAEAAVLAEAPRPKISLGAPAPAPPAQHLPPAVAIALEPNVERAISLPLEDVIAQMPEGYLKPRETLDTNRPILVRAAEVEKGMARGRPEIRVAALFQQAPDIFMHTVPATDGARVALPFERVMTALSNLSRRSDQAAEQAVPQVETPFLQVTMEDTKRFGMSLPVQPTQSATAEPPPVRIEPASAEAFAAAVPEAKQTFVPPKPADVPDATAGEGGNGRAAMRIPFTPPGEPKQFGTGEPAFPRVPASSGPPVPPAPPMASTPPRIAFDFPAPSEKAEDLEGATKSGVASDVTGVIAPPAAGDSGSCENVPGYNDTIITLPLRSILQLLPPMQLGGNPATVPADAAVSFPINTIAPQLASGKVVVKPNAFYAALPEEYRKLFLADAANALVQLPLADVLANMPGEALRMREDQEVHAPEQVFETPFSAKAAEDAARFANNGTKGGGGEALVSNADADESSQRLAQAPLQDELPKADPPGEAAPKFDAREAVAKACGLDGVEACSVIFADGLNIAGNIPESMQLGGLSAMAPTLLQKLGKHMLQTSLGSLHCLTVHGEKAPVSFFSAGDICLTALHRSGLAEATRGELTRITEELSRTYSETVS